MIEPGVRYLPTAPSPLATHMALEAAVDLSKKASEDSWHIPHREDNMEVEDGEESDDDVPLDMSVTSRLTPTFPHDFSHHRLTPIFPGFHRNVSPAPSDRSDMFIRLPGMYSPSPGSQGTRDQSADRSEADKDEYGRDACQFCGCAGVMFNPGEHGEGVCKLLQPLSCPLCSKSFTIWSHYEAHKKCHQKLKQRQYPCQTCGKIFTSASNRNMHQRIHKGVRPFQCIPCGVYFRQKAHLQKHQKTQGHIQATELFEKKKAEGLIPDIETQIKTEPDSGETQSSEDSTPAVDSSTTPTRDEEPSSKVEVKSPKRKQSRPQHSPLPPHLTMDKDEGPLDPREAQIRCNIEYNNMSHGYDCRQCDYSTHDLSVMKDHVRNDHLQDKADLQCKECQITFTKPFNLLIHNRKHETSSQFLPCEYCEQVFKVPNKLIKHMEGVHSVCPTCGKKNVDKPSLHEHVEVVHGEPKKTVQIGLTQFPVLSSFIPIKPKREIENRHEKMRKLDSLAEHIRAKQLQNSTLNLSNIINGNNKEQISPLESQLVIPRRRKSDMPAVRALLDRKPEDPVYIKPGLETLVSQLNRINPVQDILRKSENNNILSSLSKMSQELPQSFFHKLPKHPIDRSIVEASELTPPSSPPPTLETHIRIKPEISVTMVNHSVSDSDDSNEMGLDLTVKKYSLSDENEVSTTAEERNDHEDFYRHRPHIPHSFPYIVPAFPFMGGLGRLPLPPLPHHNSHALTEHLFKLASISRGHALPPPPPPSISKPVSLHGHQVSMSSLLIPRPMTSPLPPNGFPVFPGGIPPSMFPQQPLPPRPEDRALSPVNSLASAGQGIESKPFRCTYCTKHFGHLSSLESHIERFHTNESRHNCEVCGKAFSSKSNLTAHKKIHSGERPFECAVCQKRFRQKAHLQKHETTHSSATPYQCPHCDKAFGHPSNLNTHVATHSDVRPYECNDCGKSYKDSASFKRHRMVHTGERPYPCSLCADTFIDSKSLRRHREVIHPSAGSDPELDDADDEDEEIEPGKEEMFDANSNIESVGNYEYSQPMIHSPFPPPEIHDDSKSMFVEPQSPPSPESKPLVLDTSVDDTEDEEIDDDEDENNFEDSGICDPTETSMTDIDSSIDNNQSLNSSGITA